MRVYGAPPRSGRAAIARVLAASEGSFSQWVDGWDEFVVDGWDEFVLAGL